MNVPKNIANGSENGHNFTNSKKIKGLASEAKTNERENAPAPQERDVTVTPPGDVLEIYLITMEALGCSEAHFQVDLKGLTNAQLLRLEWLAAGVAGGDCFTCGSGPKKDYCLVCKMGLVDFGSAEVQRFRLAVIAGIRTGLPLTEEILRPILQAEQAQAVIDWRPPEWGFMPVTV